MQLARKKVIDEVIGLVKGELKEATVEDVRVGIFYTGVKLSPGYGGVAFTPVHEIKGSVCCPKAYGKMPEAGSIAGRSVGEVLDYAQSPHPLQCSIGVAALNAASYNILFSRDDVRYDVDALDLVDVRDEDSVVMVGAFSPFIRRLKGKVKALHVFDRSFKALEEEGLPAQPEASLSEELQHSDVVIVTGSTLVTQTLDDILTQARNAREMVLAGSTASIAPGPLFARGVTVMGGIRIDDADKMLRVISEGGSGYTLLNTCARKFAVRKGGI